MSPFRWMVVVLTLGALGVRASPGDAARVPDGKFMVRDRLLERSGSLPSHPARLAELPSLYRRQGATSAPDVLSPPNTRVSDPSTDHWADSQSRVSIAAWQNEVVAIWLDAQLDDQGQFFASTVGYAYSCDGGATFTDGGDVPLPAFDDWVDLGELTVDGQGNFYAVLNMQHGTFSGNPIGYTMDVHAVWKGTFTGCSFAWGNPTEITTEPADPLKFLSFPFTAADPIDGTLYVAYARHVAQFTQQIEVTTSRDGGATWSTPTILEQPRPNHDPDDPRLAVGPDHEVYVVWSADPKFAYLSCDNSNLGPNDEIRFSRSLDHGATWRAAAAIAAEFGDRWACGPGDFSGRAWEVPSIAVDRSDGPRRGALYVSWPEAGRWDADPVSADTVQEAEPDDLPLGANRLVLGSAGKGAIHDLDDADDWKIDLQAGDDVLFFLQPDDWICGPINAGHQIFTLRLYPEPGNLGEPPDTLIAGSSIQFSPSRIVFSCKRSGTYELEAQMTYAETATPAGYTLSARRIHFLPPIAAAPARDDRDIVLVSSIDKGTTWSPKALVNGDSPTGYVESLPVLVVDDAGALEAFWYDHRQTEAANAPVGLGVLTDVYMAQSVDGVEFSPARRVTDASSLFLGVPTYDWNIGDFQSACAIGRELLFGWSDGRPGNAGTDVYFNRIVRPRGETNTNAVRFPEATEGDSIHAEVDLANHGAVPLEVDAISVPFDRMTVTPPPPFQIAVDDSVRLRFDLAPTTPGDSTGAIHIRSSDPFDSVQVLPILARPRRLGFQIVSEDFFRDPIAFGQYIPVVVLMNDSVHVDSLSVCYRVGGETGFSRIPMALKDAHYRAFIPESMVGSRGVEFYVEARNGEAKSDVPSPFTPDRFQVRVGDLDFPARPADAFTLISVPLVFDQTSLMDLLRDDLGATDRTTWRLFALDASTPDATSYRELSDHDAMQVRPGEAYWLITRGASALDTAPASGLSTPTSVPFALTLSRTWNMIASPFDFPVAWRDILVDGVPTSSQSVVESPLAWNPGTRSYESSAVLEPFAGYFVKRNGTSPVTLSIPPVASSGASAPTSPRARASAPGDWTLRLRVAGEEGSDVAEIGVATGAREERDRLDVSHPPLSPGPGVLASIPHPEWGDDRGAYRRDVRAPLASSGVGSAASGHVWPLTVGARSDRQPWAEMTLDVSGIETLPEGLQAILVDDRLERVVDLRANPRYRFVEATSGGETRPRFRVLVGDGAFLAHGAEGLASSWDHLSDPSPNPFHARAMIEYGVGRTGPARLEIFDIQGRLVKTLVSGTVQPGTYEVLWSGSTDRGAGAAPGLYFLRLTTPGHVETRKLLKLS